ncbi:MAG: ankyrin repeat domain-containing protein, partial [[Mycobacterium] stephanolepidis]
MASTLPTNPSRDRLRDEARGLQRAVRTADPEAAGVVRQHHPRPDIALAGQQFALHDAQLTVARRYGFTGWPALVHYVELAAGLSTDPSAVSEAAL